MNNSWLFRHARSFALNCPIETWGEERRAKASLLRAAFVIRTPWRHLFVVIFTAELKPLITRTLDNPKELSFPLRLISFSKGLLFIARNMSSTVPCLSYIVCCAMEILNSLSAWFFIGQITVCENRKTTTRNGWTKGKQGWLRINCFLFQAFNWWNVAW